MILPSIYNSAAPYLTSKFHTKVEILFVIFVIPIYPLIPSRREENNPVDVSNAQIVIESVTDDEKSKTYGLLET